MTAMNAIAFERADLARAVEALSEAEIDALPFGAIRLDAAGEVSFYSEAERRQSGFRRAAVGRNFFADIAPCLDNSAFRGRIDQAIAAGRLDISFDHVGDFPNGERDVAVRVRVQSAAQGGCWIFMEHED